MDRKLEDIKHGLTGGILKPAGGADGITVSRVLCDKTFSADIGGDFELPDTMPELKKLIKVDVRPEKPASFISGSGVQINGGVEYSAIYMGSDGEIYKASFPDEFSINAPFDGANVGFDKILVSAKACPESITCRASGMGRINIRARLAVKVISLCAEKRGGGFALQEESHIRKLVKKCPSCLELRGIKEDASLSCSVDTSGQGTRYLSSDCKVFVTDSTAGDGYVDCRGYAAVRHLMTRGGEMYTLSEKIPFSETVELDGVSSSASAAVSGICTAIVPAVSELDVENDNKTELVLHICLSAAALVPCTLEYVKDMYSTLRNYGLEFEKTLLPRAVACKNGNMTFSGREEASKLGIENDRASVIDVWGSSRTESIEKEDDMYIMKGKCRFAFLYSAGEEGEASLGECEMPFKYEFEGDGDAVSRFDASVAVIEPRARFEGDKLAFDCELAISLCAVGEGEICSVTSAKSDGSEREKRKGFTVCYPDGEDSLWSVAKRYGAPIEDAAKENGMDGFGDADEIRLPAGVKYMII